MREPEFIKIDIDLVEGMKDRIKRQHNDGESYAEMYADNFNNRLNFDTDVDQESLVFQRPVAFDIAISISIVDEYMKSHGWNFNYKTGKWVKEVKE